MADARDTEAANGEPIGLHQLRPDTVFTAVLGGLWWSEYRCSRAGHRGVLARYRADPDGCSGAGGTDWSWTRTGARPAGVRQSRAAVRGDPRSSVAGGHIDRARMRVRDPHCRWNVPDLLAGPCRPTWRVCRALRSRPGDTQPTSGPRGCRADRGWVVWMGGGASWCPIASCAVSTESGQRYRCGHSR